MKCKHCGDCCGKWVLIVSENQWKRIEYKFNDVEYFPRMIKELHGINIEIPMKLKAERIVNGIQVTANAWCKSLNLKTKLCRRYKSRPSLCRRFNCTKERESISVKKRICNRCSSIGMNGVFIDYYNKEDSFICSECYLRILLEV